MVKGERRRKERVKEENSKKLEYKKGLWSSEEDRLLLEHVKVHGKGKWNRIPQLTGLKRCGKSCRLRWMNYLSPNIKTGDFSQEEDDLIIRLHKLLGNRWSLIAGRVPGRTDNQVKNYWNSHLSKKLGIKKGKAKLIEASSPTNKGESSSDTPSMEELKERSSGLENQNENLQTLISEDDELILNNQSLFDFLSEYCLDYTWSNGL